jgi:hypothetical protein
LILAKGCCLCQDEDGGGGQRLADALRPLAAPSYAVEGELTLSRLLQR